MTKVYTQADYARHRGVSKMTVSRAVTTGRLVKCVIRDSAGKPLGISDFELADQEWAANSDYTDAPQRAPATVPVAPEGTPATDPNSISSNAAAYKYWQAKTAEQKFKRESGELVLAKDVEHKITEVFSEVRTKLLGVPSRAKQELPELTVEAVQKIDALVREALAGLAGPGEAE